MGNERVHITISEQAETLLKKVAKADRDCSVARKGGELLEAALNETSVTINIKPIYKKVEELADAQMQTVPDMCRIILAREFMK